MMKCVVLAALLVPLGLSAAPAERIYRCGESYSQTRCTGGTLVDTADPRTSAQRAEASRMAAREKQLATRMERDRRARESGQTPLPAAALDSPRVATPVVVPVAVPPRHLRRPARHAAASNPDFIATDATKGRPAARP